MSFKKQNKSNKSLKIFQHTFTLPGKMSKNNVSQQKTALRVGQFDFVRDSRRLRVTRVKRAFLH